MTTNEPSGSGDWEILSAPGEEGYVLERSGKHHATREQADQEARDALQAIRAMAAMEKHGISVVQLYPQWRACVMGSDNEGVVSDTPAAAILSLAAKIEGEHGEA